MQRFLKLLFSVSKIWNSNRRITKGLLKKTMMYYFQDTGFLLLYCMFSVLYAAVNPEFVLGFLCALILCCACYFSEYGKVRVGLSLLFPAFALFFPSFFCFFPVVAYILLWEKKHFFVICVVLFFLCHVRFSAEPAFLPLLIGVTGFLLAYLLQSRSVQYQQADTRLRQIQDDSREHNLLLAEKNKAILEAQNYEIYAATLRERNRIAREIHDNVGHVLSRSILLLGAVKTVNREPALTALLKDLDISLNSAMDSIRNSVHDLHEESVNLKETVQNLVRDFTFCPIELHYDMSFSVAGPVRYCFISITKEALSNIIKHSNASRVQISMQEHPGLYQLRIEDNGTTCSRKKTSPSSLPGGIGLTNMRDRVQALDGTFRILTDSGFRIFITIPKKNAIIEKEESSNHETCNHR